MSFQKVAGKAELENPWEEVRYYLLQAFVPLFCSYPEDP